MRFAIIAAAAAALVCAGQAEAARYYQFEVRGYAEFAGVLSPDGLTKAMLYQSTTTFAFDTQNPSQTGYLSFGSGYNVQFDILNGVGRLSTLNMPAGPAFNASFSLANVAASESLAGLNYSGGSFGYIIVPDSRSPQTVIRSSKGGIVSIVARTSDVAPANLNVTQQLSVTAVPEPATWAMMILGLAAVGFALRRRDRNVTTTVSYAA